MIIIIIFIVIVVMIIIRISMATTNCNPNHLFNIISLSFSQSLYLPFDNKIKIRTRLYKFKIFSIDKEQDLCHLIKHSKINHKSKLKIRDTKIVLGKT